MALMKTTLEVHFAWWLKPYFCVLAAMCAITGREPNYERVQYWIDRGVTVRVWFK